MNAVKTTKAKLHQFVSGFTMLIIDGVRTLLIVQPFDLFKKQLFSKRRSGV